MRLVQVCASFKDVNEDDSEITTDYTEELIVVNGIHYETDYCRIVAILEGKIININLCKLRFLDWKECLVTYFIWYSLNR